MQDPTEHASEQAGSYNTSLYTSLIVNYIL